MRSSLFLPALAILLMFAWPVCAGASTEQEVGECAAPGAETGRVTVQPLYRLDGVEYFEDDLPPNLQQAFFELRLEQYHKQLELIDAAVLSAYLDKALEGSGKTRQQIVEEMFGVARPDDEAVASFYEANQDRIGYPLEQVREQLRQMLTEQAAREKRDEFLGTMKQMSGFEASIEKPAAPYVEISIGEFPSKGPADAPVTIVEFADYQCPHCKTAAQALSKIVEQYPEEVQVVFMDFPVNRSGVSREVAKGAACAAKQGEFWAYHDLAFERQSSLTRQSPLELAQALELNEDEFASCFDSPAAEDQVATSEREAARIGISATPTLFLNGRRLHLQNLDGELRELIERTLAAEAS